MLPRSGDVSTSLTLSLVRPSPVVTIDERPLTMAMVSKVLDRLVV